MEFISALHLAIIDQFGENAQDVLYRGGYEWGLQEMVRLNEQLRTDVGENFDLWQADAKFILDSWWTPLADAGWGRCAFDLTRQARGMVGIELRGSVVAAAFPGSDDPVCHIYAGMFGGALSFFERGERHAVEIECAGARAPLCRFLVAAGAQIDSVETWRQQGAAAAEILRRLN
jgi:predicted hydrocarbon binding protein